MRRRRAMSRPPGSTARSGFRSSKPSGRSIAPPTTRPSPCCCKPAGISGRSAAATPSATSSTGPLAKRRCALASAMSHWRWRMNASPPGRAAPQTAAFSAMPRPPRPDGSPDRGAEDPHVVAARDLSGLLGGEAAAQHRRDELDPLRIVLDTAGGSLLVGADADVLDPDDVGHLLEALDIFVEAREG